MNKTQQVTIVGGGFSGLTLALELSKKNIQVELIEKSARLGGLLGTQQTNWGPVETAANALIMNSEVAALAKEIDWQPVGVLKDAKNRYIFRGHLRRWPLRITETCGFLARLVGHWWRGKQTLQPLAKESMATWSDRHFGKACTQFLIGPALQGIYAGDVQQLSAPLILSSMFDKNRELTQGSVSGDLGMQDLISALENYLRRQGVQIHCHREFTLSEKNDQPVVIATSVQAAAKILQNHFPELTEQLDQIETAPLISVTAFWSEFPKTNRGFGCVIARNQGIRCLGVLMNSFIFPGRDKTYSETYIYGGATDEQILTLSDADLRELVILEQKNIFARDAQLLHLEITRWPEGLPQYNLVLEEVLHELRLPENIFLHGNYLGVIGLSKILHRSKLLAEAIAANIQLKPSQEIGLK